MPIEGADAGPVQDPCGPTDQDTDGDGCTFRTSRPARAGRSYVTVTSPEQPLCAPARSGAVRLERA